MPELRHPYDFFRHYFIPGRHNVYRPRILHRPILIFFLALILATEGFLVSNLIARESDQQFLAAVVPAEIIALTNDERKAQNDGAVIEDALLDKAAQAKAEDMAAKSYFAHVGPDGKTPWQWISEAGYQYQYAGENLAVRFIDSKDVVEAWMDSPTHRANIVKPVYTAIGVGVAQGMYQGERATYVVQYFGTPKAAKAAVVPSRTATQPAAVAEAPATNTQVQGAAVEAPVETHAEAQSNSFTQTVTRQLIRAFSEPQHSANVVLAFLGSLLVLALFLAFFMHMHIQHPAMLAAGAFVAAVAFFFLAINVHLMPGTSATQTANVVSSSRGVVVTNEAAEVGYALFPN